MGLAKEFENFKGFLNRLENELRTEQGAVEALGGAKQPSARASDCDGLGCVRDQLRRLDAHSNRVEARYDGLDRRLSQVAARMDEIETRIGQRSHLLEVQVQNLRESLPAVIEES